MIYRSDPRSGKQLSQLGFGLMRLPRGLTGTDLEKTTAMLEYAVGQGLNYFDTAYVYPGSETTFGRALEASGLRDQLNIATKLPHQQCRSAADFDRIFNEQLNRLKTDHIDYYLIHNLPKAALWQRLVDIGIKEWIEEKKASGQIGQIGFSFHGSQADFLELLDAYDWEFCQIQYNYLDVNYQAGQLGLKAAYERGLMIVIMEPLRGGRLANGLPKKAEELMQASDRQASYASWAFRWLFDQAEPTVVLSGMGSIDQLTDNINTASSFGPGMLSAEQHQLIEDVINIVANNYRINCTGCSYCMPCPQGVNIPDCFAAYNTYHSQGFIAGVSQYMTGIASPRPDRYSGPTKCIACGTCEQKCPQGIPIIDSLKEVKQLMEPFWYKPAMAAMKLVMG
ncbi:MAG: aldo/keto reductase [Coriobacteriia bacterium]|nr:aldo/keto reductase [Coriobacteriia bacterium]